MVEASPPDEAARLGTAPFTYAEVGATAAAPPPGHQHFARTRVLGPGALRRLPSG